MLNPIEEAKFAELRDKCRDLRVLTPPDIFIGLQVHDKGNLIFDDVQRGHSWTRNLWNCMFMIFSSGKHSGTSWGAGYLTGKRTGSTVDYADNAIASGGGSQAGFMGGSTGDGAMGILVGTGDTAYSADQYVLVSPVGQGDSTGQLSYQTPTNSSAPTYDALSKTWSNSVSRIINNNSGGTITIKEVGLYANTWRAASSSGYTYMFERSVLSPTVAVANGAQLTVTYGISMDFSAID